MPCFGLSSSISAYAAPIALTDALAPRMIAVE
jgi:hypothetical protein